MITIESKTGKIKEEIFENNFGKMPEYNFDKYNLDDFSEEDYDHNIGGILIPKKKIKEMRNKSVDKMLFNKDIKVELSEKKSIVMKTLEGEILEFNKTGFDQFCQRYDVPSRYMQKCILKGEENLAVENLNHWIKKAKPEKENLVRLYDNRIRAYRSDEYSIMDNLEVINNLHKSIYKKSDQNYLVERYALNQEKFNLRLVREEQININGEILHVGLRLKNSEIGFHKLQLELLVYKSICSNGMIFGGGSGSYSHKHLGDNSDMRANFNRFIEYIPNSLENIKNLVENSMDKKLTGERIQLVIDRFCNNFKIEDEEEKEKLYALPGNYGNNLWGVTNAITEYAQKFSPDTQESIELYASNLIFRG